MQPKNGRPTRGSAFFRDGRWVIRFQVDGARRQIVTDARTRAEAHVELRRQLARTDRTAISRGRTDMPLGEVLEAWGQARKDRHDVPRLRRVVEALGPDLRPDDLSVPALVAYRDARLRDRSPGTVKRELSLLSSLYVFALERGLAGRNPVRDCPKPADTRERIEGLSMAEARDALAAVQGHRLLEPAYRLSLYAAMRRGEIAGARWEDLDLEAETLLVRGTKTNGSHQTIPLHPRLAEYLRSRERVTETIVWGIDRKTRRPAPVQPNAFQCAHRRFDGALPGLNLMRHTLATNLVRQGASMSRVSRLMRHASVDVTERHYAHLRPIDARDELSRVDFGI